MPHCCGTSWLWGWLGGASLSHLGLAPGSVGSGDCDAIFWPTSLRQRRPPKHMLIAQCADHVVSRMCCGCCRIHDCAAGASAPMLRRATSQCARAAWSQQLRRGRRCRCVRPPVHLASREAIAWATDRLNPHSTRRISRIVSLSALWHLRPSQRSGDRSRPGGA